MNILLIDGRMFIFLKKVVRDLMTKPIQSSSSIVLLTQATHYMNYLTKTPKFACQNWNLQNNIK